MAAGSGRGSRWGLPRSPVALDAERTSVECACAEGCRFALSSSLVLDPGGRLREAGLALGKALPVRGKASLAREGPGIPEPRRRSTGGSKVQPCDRQAGVGLSAFTYRFPPSWAASADRTSPPDPLAPKSSRRSGATRSLRPAAHADAMGRLLPMPFGHYFSAGSHLAWLAVGAGARRERGDASCLWPESSLRPFGRGGRGFRSQVGGVRPAGR